MEGVESEDKTLTCKYCLENLGSITNQVGLIEKSKAKLKLTKVKPDS